MAVVFEADWLSDVLYVDHQVAMNVYELSSAAGLPCEIDPALVVALSSQKSGKMGHSIHCFITQLIHGSPFLCTHHWGRLYDCVFD
jgi:hypothetical protein